jgi:AcrR family transcriptional regulator
VTTQTKPAGVPVDSREPEELSEICRCRQKKRRRILDAAARAFAAEDFHKVSTEKIAMAAGVGKGTLFRYFSSKEELFIATLSYSVDVAGAEMDRALAGLDDPVERLETVCEHLFAFYRDNMHLFHLLHHDKALQEKGHDQVHEKQNRLRGKIAEMIQAGIRSGRFRQVDPVVSGRLLFGMLRTVMRSPEFKDGTPQQVSRTVLDLFTRGVGRRPEAAAAGEAAPPGRTD